MEYNKLNEVPIGNLNSQEVNMIKEFEKELNNKYILIAFEKENIK